MNKTKSIIFTILMCCIIVLGVTLKDELMQPKQASDYTNYTIPVSGDKTGYYRHCYEELNSEEKVVYSIVLEQLYSQPERIEVPSLVNGDLEKIFHAISYDNPDLFNVGRNCEMYTEGSKCYFSVDYNYDFETYQSYLDQVEAVVQKIVDAASRYPDDYSKEKYVHDYIINNCTYVASDSSVNASNVYGCLVEGKAACEGYSRSFQYLLNRLNIDNRIVTGEGASDGVNFIAHMWNFVYIDDCGYFVDVTWDDPVGETNVVRHAYFNVTTADILKKHRSIEQVLPLCTDTKHNYFLKENLYFTYGSGDEFVADVTNAVIDARSCSNKFFELRFANMSVMLEATQSLFDGGVIFDAFRDAGLVSQGQTDVSVTYSEDEYMYTMVIYF